VRERILIKKPNDYLAKKKVKKNIDAALHMNNASLEYLIQLEEKYAATFTTEEKENLKNLRRYLEETLNVFFKNLMPK
jgi:hypothetical protein